MVLTNIGWKVTTYLLNTVQNTSCGNYHNQTTLLLVNQMLSDDLRLLSVETDGWLSIHRVAMEDHFKIAKPHKINKVVEILEYKLAKALK